MVILGQDPYHGPNQAHGKCDTLYTNTVGRSLHLFSKQTVLVGNLISNYVYFGNIFAILNDLFSDYNPKTNFSFANWLSDFRVFL